MSHPVVDGDYSAIYDPDTDVDRHITLATARRIRRWLRPGDRVAELGCATGLMTSVLAEAGVELTAVERLPSYVAAARARALPGVRVLDVSIDDFDPPAPLHHVVATQLLNEVPDPLALLRRARGWLAPGGLVHVSLVNPRSVHRMIALEMGLIGELGEQSERGSQLANRRHLDGPQLEALGREAGLNCLHREPVLLKPLTHAQLAALPDEVIEGLDRVARHFPEHGALNYAVFAPTEDARP